MGRKGGGGRGGGEGEEEEREEEEGERRGGIDQSDLIPPNSNDYFVLLYTWCH